MAVIVDVSDTTATPDKVQTGFKFYDAAGRPQYGTAIRGQGITIEDTTDSAGGTIRTITTQLIEPYTPIGENATCIKTINLPQITAANTDYESKKSLTTAQVILAAASVDSISVNMNTYSYIVRWYMSIQYAYQTGTAQAAMPMITGACFDSAVIRQPSSYTNKKNNNYNYNNKIDMGNTHIVDYYNTNGTMQFVTGTYGIIMSNTTFTYSDRYDDVMDLGIYSAALSVSAVNNAYFSAATRAALDPNNTIINRYIEIYQVERDTSYQPNRYRAALALSNTLN